jgi:hypothetical protein
MVLRGDYTRVAPDPEPVFLEKSGEKYGPRNSKLLRTQSSQRFFKELSQQSPAKPFGKPMEFTAPLEALTGSCYCCKI